MSSMEPEAVLPRHLRCRLARRRSRLRHALDPDAVFSLQEICSP
jgi:hypothetical protein